MEFAPGFDHMVRGHDNHHPIFVCRLNKRRCHSNARGGVPFERLANNVLDRQIWKLRDNRIDQLGVGGH
jgi:hypothetical protein